MPNASKYIIDVASIRPGGSPIKGLYVGSSEKKYATLGNKCIYDKVLYELSVDNITNVEPNAQTVTISSYTSKRTHGDGAVDTLYINPSTKQVTANTNTANTKDTTVVVNQALTLNGATTGTGVTVTITQMKDYPIGLTLTISPKSTIPAAGGSISSSLTNYTYSVKANYKSGNNNVDVTSDSNTTITANVTGVTAASKGTTESNATTAGTIRFTASYTCNGKTVATTMDVNITQDRNEVVSYANPTFTLTPSSNQTLPASGGRVTASVSDVRQVRTWSSTSTDTFTPSYTTEWNAQTISCDSRGTVTGDTLTLGTTTATVTANGKPTTKSYVVYQQANKVTDYSKPTGLNLSCADIPAGGGTVTAASGGTISQTRTYTSKATDTINPTVTITWNPSQTATANSLGTTVKERTKITTLTATYTANSQSNTASVDVYQGANAQSTTPLWEDISLTAVTLSCEDVPASGGTVTPSWSGQVQQNRRYQYTSGSYTDWELVNITPTVSWSPTSKTGNNLGQTDKVRTSLGDCTATFTGNSSKTATKAITVYQEDNTHTDSWDNPVVTITYATFSAAGATKTPTTCSATQSGTRTWTSGSQTGITNTTDFTWGDYSMTNGTGFTLANASTGAVTAESRGTTTGASRSNSTIRRIVTGAGSKQGTGSGTVAQEANDVTDSDYNASNYDYWARCSIGDGLTADGGSASVSASAGHTHKYYYLYTSNSTSGPYYSSPSDGVSTSMIGNGNSRFSYSNGTISHSSMGTDVTTDTVTIRATNNANGSTADASKEIVNKLESTTWGDITGTPTGSCSDIPAGGGTVTATATTPQTLAQNYKYNYTSGSQDANWKSTNVSCSVSYPNGNTATASSLGTTVKDRTHVATLTVRASANGKTKDGYVYVYQQANDVTSTEWGDLSLTAVTLSCGDVPARGGTVTPSWSGTAKQNRRYQYTSGSYTDWELANITPTVTWNPTSISGSDLGTTVIARTSIGDCTATFTGNSSRTATKSITVYQQANDVTNSDYNASNIDYWASCSIGDGLTAAGGSATVTASAGHTHKYYYLYTSQSTSGPYYSRPSDGVSTSMIGNGNSRFSYSNGTISHSSMGTDVTTDTVTIRATNAANTSATGDASKEIVNKLESTTWGDITVIVPSNQSVSSDGGSLFLDRGNTKATQSGTSTYTSESTSTLSKNYYPSNTSVTWDITSSHDEFIIKILGGMTKAIEVSWGTNNSTSSRSATITVSCTANGKTGSNSFTITQAAGVRYQFTVINNSSTYGLRGNFRSITPTGQIFPEELPPGANYDVDMVSDTVIIKDYFGQVPGKTSGTVTFTCSGASEETISGSIQLIDSVNMVYGIDITDSLTVKNGTTITITIS